SLTVTCSKYENITFDGYGAVFATRTPKSGMLATLNVDGTTFKNNHAKLDGGAIANYNALTITGSVFEGNTANLELENGAYSKVVDMSTSIGGGAIALGAVSDAKIASITDTKFINNISGHSGGAIGTRLGNVADNSGAKLKVSAYFKGNHAFQDGGALYNTFYAGEKGVEVTGEFDGNTAGVSGGAIYNDGAKDYYKNDGGKMTITDSTFTANESGVDGGAIFNTGDLKISSSVFDKNVASIEGEGYGGAIFSNARGLNIDGTDFTNNTAYSGGAIYESRYSAYSSDNAKGMVISDAAFTSNHAAADGGAIGLSKKATITDAVFTSNTAGLSEGGISAASDANGGGAVYVAQYGQATLSNVKFYDNKSGAHGGAIGARHNVADGGFLSLTNAIFEGNSATKEGGAIASIYNGAVNIEGATFTNNTAGTNGGAIYIGVADNFGGSDGKSTPSTGGGTINFSGLNTFSGNSDAKGLNDIYNDGSINVLSGAELQLDGGISGTGSIVFESGSKLQVNANETFISNDVTNNGVELSMVFKNAYTGTYEMVTGTVTGAFGDVENSLYDIIETDVLGTFEISKKSSEEIAENTGASGSQAEALDAVLSGTSESNENFNTAADNIVGMLQNEETKSEGLKALDAMSAEAAPIVKASQTNLVNQIHGVVSTRMTGGNINAGKGKSSGDLFENAATWVQGMINHTKLDGQFNTDTNGLAFGFERHVNDEIKVGVAYALAKTDIESYSRDTQVKTHSAIAYAEYKPSNWFVNGILSYSVSDYEEDKVVAGVNGEADYKATNISLQAVTGYEYLTKHALVTPTFGLRYMNIDRDGYTDALGTNVDSNNMDTLTAVLGVKFSANYVVREKTYTPELRMAVTYDLIRDDDNALVTLANGAAYSVNNSGLKRFAYEFGAGITTAINDEWELNVAYEGKFRKDYQDHTGLINAKFHF
ncbi:MAG: autotransporter domain-containing protein, partial [Alphaproteobacteria bacterium]|nr:autotransporter domain-containing protein [Alphaproteobacteria bacterium]